MNLIADTSAWIEYLLGTDSRSCVQMRRAIESRDVVVVDPVLLEVMAGARRNSVDSTLRLLDAQQLEPMAPRLDWLDAATIYRELRRRGVTIRSQTDALIAAAAIRIGLPVLHHDRDFDRIADHTPLRTVTG